ncbi:MAG: tRNA 2-thiouridine synthesizing protein C [Alteromonadaceae bacterium]|jgi:tRNA 2-thiouridine synthesizing protein C
MSNTRKSVAILNSSAPFASAKGKEALDVALIFGSYEQDTALFFQGDGVWQLVAQQTPEKITMKDYLKTFAAFEFYDIEHIYVCAESLAQRALAPDFHIDNVSVLSISEFSKELHQRHILLRF